MRVCRPPHLLLVVLPAATIGLAMDPADTDGVFALPELQVHSPRVANETPADTYATPVSALTFEPFVDVQTRNFAEGQADISIRGATFENTGFRVGALPIYDPQTGHYAAEIPIAPDMLSAPAVLAGADNAQSAWNATAGTLLYGWNPIRSGGQVSMGAGGDSLLRGEFYTGWVAPNPAGKLRVGADLDAATSQGDGSRPFGDHDFERYNARVQLRSESTQTDVFAGHQSKEFSWVNLYAPFDTPEIEDIRTDLFVINHRVEIGADGDYLQAGAYYRENRDTYQLPAFAYENNHKTTVRGVALDGRNTLAARTTLLYRAGFIADEIDSRSTSPTGALTFGHFNDRTQSVLGTAVEQRFPLGDEGRELAVTAGTQFDDSNRHSSEWSPSARIELRPITPWLRKLYLAYDETTQVPTYQALNANAGAGLFRGNPDLPRATSQNIELGAAAGGHQWSGSLAVFFRKDRDALDYIYDPSLGTGTARSAVAGDLETLGAEALIRYHSDFADLILGYTFLHKTEDYLTPAQASFYQFNFAKHRLTAAITLHLSRQLDLRMDNEYRIQEPNSLRRRYHDPLISVLGLAYRVPQIPGLTLSAQVDNLWNTYFEEVPLVPSARRTWSVTATYQW